MLSDVLEFISKKGDFSTISIARNLGISEPMAEDIKDKLIRMGYIEKISECTVEACEKCSCGCGKTKNLDRSIKWSITEKGNKLINKLGGRV